MESNEYSNLLSNFLTNLSKGTSVVPEGSSIINEDRRLVKFYGSVEIVDTEGDIVPISEIEKVAQKYIDRGGLICWNHMGRGGIPVAKALGYEITTWNASEYPERAKELGLPKDFSAPAIVITAEVFKDYERDDEVWRLIKAGEIRQVSLGGRSSIPIKVYNPKTGKTVVERRGLEIDEWAFVKKGMNKMADFIAIGGEKVLKTFNSGGDITSMPELEKIAVGLEDDGWSPQDSWDIVKGVVENIAKECDVDSPYKTEKIDGKDGTTMPDNEEKEMEDVDKTDISEYVTVTHFDTAITSLNEKIEKMLVYPKDGKEEGGTNSPSEGGGGEAQTNTNDGQHWVTKEDVEAMFSNLETKIKDMLEKFLKNK